MDDADANRPLNPQSGIRTSDLASLGMSREHVELRLRLTLRSDRCRSTTLARPVRARDRSCRSEVGGRDVSRGDGEAVSAKDVIILISLGRLTIQTLGWGL